MKKTKRNIIQLFLLCFLTLSSIYISSNLANSSSIKTNDNYLSTADSFVNGGGYLIDTEATYAWEEIEVSGTLLDISTETFGVQKVNFSDAGWTFTFYNTIYDKIYVRSQGWMTFTDFGAPGFWQIPYIESYDYDFLSLCMSYPEIDVSIGGNIYYQFLSSPNRLVIEYSGIYTSESQLVGDFEVIFYESGNIKFQYKNIYDVFYQAPVIGLDHGDGLNYNSYNPDLPMQSMAIEFTFDKMMDPNYGPNFEESDEFSWIVTKIDVDKIESFFGSDWEDEFGLLQDPVIEDKMKIKISTIGENSTDWEINYNIWDWINRFDIFTTPSGSDTLIYKKDPNTYKSHNLTNIIPFLLPNRTCLYLLRANLTHYYDTMMILYSNQLYWYKSKTIGSDNIQMNIHAFYTEDGILSYMDMNWHNDSSSEQKTIFKLETFRSLFLEPSAMNTQVDDEHWFYVRNANDSIMEANLGSDWQQLLGIPTNAFIDSKFKIKINQNYDNVTHWISNYSLWDCIDRDDSFSLPPTSNYSLPYLKDPFNYTTPHLWDPIIPLFLPSLAEMYTAYANLDYSFYQDKSSSVGYPAEYPPTLAFNLGGSLSGRAVYSHDGYLRELTIEYMEMIGMTFRRVPVLRICHFSEGPIPAYVGISPGETYSYGIFNCSKVSSSPTNFKRMNITIDFVSGEDPYLESVLVLANISYLRDDDIWLDEIDLDDYSSGIPFRSINYIYPNSSENMALSLLAFNSLPLFVEIGVNWSSFVSALQENYPATYPYTVTFENLTNGFEALMMYRDEIFTYTSEGALEIVSFSSYGQEFYTMRLNDFDYVIEGCDIYDPILTINAPITYSLHGIRAPGIDLSIEEDYLDTVWYNLNNGTVKTNNYTFTGIISQSAWDQVGNGSVTITFYANDTNGNIGMSEIILRKDAISPIIMINKPNIGVIFNTTAPDYDILIAEIYLDYVWYTMDDGLHNFSIIAYSGTLDESLWDSLSDGDITIRFYANDTAGNIGISQITVNKDTISPVVVINEPDSGDEFTANPPLYNIDITELNLDTMWYTLDSGAHNFTITSTFGTINEALWDSLPNGLVTITFYASDLAGNIGSVSVIVTKNYPTPPEPRIPGFSPLLFITFSLLAIASISLYRKQKLN